MDFTQYITIQNTTAIIGLLTGISGFIYGYRERRLNNRSKKVDILDKVQEYLKDDLEQVHKVNDVLKWRLQELESELKRLRNETTN